MTSMGSTKNVETVPDLLRILHLEDSALDHELVVRTLARAGQPCVVQRVETLDALLDALRDQPFDIILADYRLPGFTALDAWHALQNLQRPLPPFVLLSGAIGEAVAVTAIQQGISDFVAKDDLLHLPTALARVRELHTLREAKHATDAALEQSRQQLEQWAKHLQSSIEHERASIAREIHDDIGSTLTAVRFDLAWILRHSKDPELSRHAQAAQDQVQQALGASQRIMLNLRPAVLDQGLVAAIQWLADDFSRRTGVRVQCRASLTTTLDKHLELTAYRTVQESLTNISKHARCSAVTLEVSDRFQVLTVEVSDNGCGMDLATSKVSMAGGGHGLIGLHERARAVGGWLDVSSQPEKGTSIILSVPLQTQETKNLPTS